MSGADGMETVLSAHAEFKVKRHADNPWRYDGTYVPICPECRAGKCVNCSGQAWDNAADEPVSCGCTDGGHAS